MTYSGYVKNNIYSKYKNILLWQNQEAQNQKML